MDNKKVFILLEKKFISDLDYDILIKDIGTVYSDDKNLKRKIEYLKVVKSKGKEDWDYIDKTEVLKTVLTYNPQLDIEVLGADDVVIETKAKESKSKILEYIKVFAISIVLFFGAGIAIINFYEDINMLPSLNKIYYSITGINKTKPMTFLIPYAIGLGAGVVLFFSRSLGPNKKDKKEPGPMELEMFMYDSDLEDYILQDIKNKEKKHKEENQ